MDQHKSAHLCVCVCGGQITLILQSDPNPSLVIWLLLVPWQQEGHEKSCSGPMKDFRINATHSSLTQEQKCTCVILIISNLWFTSASTSVQWLTCWSCAVYHLHFCLYKWHLGTSRILKEDSRQITDRRGELFFFQSYFLLLIPPTMTE